MYSVLIIEMSHYQDPEGEYEISGFPSIELAKEFARRYVRDSVEELRKLNQNPDQLRKLWFIYGEDASVIGGDYHGSSELQYFIDHPATDEERDWKKIKKKVGIE